jgi:hypothetical protein
MLIGSILLNIWYQIGSSQMEDISSLEILFFSPICDSLKLALLIFFATICDLQ